MLLIIFTQNMISNFSIKISGTFSYHFVLDPQRSYTSDFRKVWTEEVFLFGLIVRILVCS